MCLSVYALWWPTVLVPVNGGEQKSWPTFLSLCLSATDLASFHQNTHTHTFAFCFPFFFVFVFLFFRKKGSSCISGGPDTIFSLLIWYWFFCLQSNMNPRKHDKKGIIVSNCSVATYCWAWLLLLRRATTWLLSIQSVESNRKPIIIFVLMWIFHISLHWPVAQPMSGICAAFCYCALTVATRKLTCWKTQSAL